jgi:hypothetical protein
VNAEASHGGSLEGGVPFGGGGDDAYDLTPALEKSKGGSTQLGILDSQEFTRGFLRPLPIELLHYFIDQGWSKELLFLTMVRRIELRRVEQSAADAKPELKGPPLVLEGYPIDPVAFDTFHDAVLVLAALEFGTRDNEPAVVHLPLDTSSFGWDDWEKALDANVNLKVVDGRVVIESVESSSWGFDGTGQTATLGPLQGAGQERLAARAMLDEFQRSLVKAPARVYPTSPEDPARKARTLSFFADRVAPTSGAPEWPATRWEVRLTLRSPEAILYFFGELVRRERDARSVVRLRGGERAGRVLFQAQAPCAECGVSVRYCGRRYALDGDPRRSESMHLLALLTQLINLQKEEEDLPKSTTVRVIGG